MEQVLMSCFSRGSHRPRPAPRHAATRRPTGELIRQTRAATVARPAPRGSGEFAYTSQASCQR